MDTSPEMAASQTSSGMQVAFLLLQQNIQKHTDKNDEGSAERTIQKQSEKHSSMKVELIKSQELLRVSCVNKCI